MAWKVEERKYEITEVISFLSYVLLCGKENISDEKAGLYIAGKTY